MLGDPDYMAATSKRNLEKAWSRNESAVVSRRIETIYRSVHGLGKATEAV